MSIAAVSDVWQNILMRRTLALAVLAVLAAAGAPAGDFRFAIVGDRTGEANAAVYKQIWSEIGRLRPAFAITVGDTIQGGDDRRAEEEWREAGRAWVRFRIPRYFTPGNHDIWSEASRRIYERETGRPPFYSFDFEGAHFTVLDNSPATELSAGQLEFLEQDLKAHRERAPKFVFFHRPFWLIFLKLGSGEFPLHRLARKYGVDAIVSGHGHQFVAMERDGVRYVEVGSSGAHMDRGPAHREGFAEGWFYHHVVVDVEGGRARFTVREAAPPYGLGRTIAVAFGEP
jgi:3',5'-cyclic-AMP phosphodiesterase